MWKKNVANIYFSADIHEPLVFCIHHFVIRQGESKSMLQSCQLWFMSFWMVAFWSWKHLGQTKRISNNLVRWHTEYMIENKGLVSMCYHTGFRRFVIDHFSPDWLPGIFHWKHETCPEFMTTIPSGLAGSHLMSP